MRSLLILLFMILMVSSAYGFNIDHVTFNDKPYRIEYTGVLGALIDEYESLLEKEWRNELQARYYAGIYDDAELTHQSKLAVEMFADARYGQWWNRSFEASLDSAPRVQLYISGPSRDILDLGFARITNKFKFKLKEYEVDIAGSYAPGGFLKSGWKFKFSPSVDVSIKHPWLRSVSARFRFTWVQRGRSTIKIDVHVGYKIRGNEMFTQVNAYLVQW